MNLIRGTCFLNKLPLIIIFRPLSHPNCIMDSLGQPLDLIKLCLDEPVIIKLKGDRILTGTLHAFDQHMNLVLGDVKEQHSSQEEGPSQRSFEMLFVRGDSLVLAAPLRGSE